ncbi:hypothetical protein PV325_006910 [Microctonus aethiopoides]|nr:hypothetical protein PV325_006910 [Microctonus aethiopoides]
MEEKMKVKEKNRVNERDSVGKVLEIQSVIVHNMDVTTERRKGHNVENHRWLRSIDSTRNFCCEMENRMDVGQVGWGGGGNKRRVPVVVRVEKRIG